FIAYLLICKSANLRICKPTDVRICKSTDINPTTTDNTVRRQFSSLLLLPSMVYRYRRLPPILTFLFSRYFFPLLPDVVRVEFLPDAVKYALLRCRFGS